MSAQLSTLEQIGKTVQWYAGISRDFNDLDMLLSAARKLSALVFDFAGDVGMLYKERNRTEFQRKAEFGRIYRELMAADPRPSVAAAEKEADALCASLRDAEQQADSEHYAAKLWLDTARAVHDQMRQHISNLKSEKRAEQTGQGSQG